MTKRILIYGDSNTWGSNGEGVRYPSGVQWPHLLQQSLGSDYEVVQEGLRGRIAGDHDKREVYRNGKSGYEIAMRSASPFDYLVVALGTNDAKKKYALDAETIVDDLLWYRDHTLEYSQEDGDMGNRFKKIFYVAIADFKPDPGFAMDTAQGVRELLDREGETVIETVGIAHSADGIHYSEGGHRDIAEKVRNAIKEFEDEV